MSSDAERLAEADAKRDMKATGFADSRRGFHRHECAHPPERQHTMVMSGWTGQTVREVCQDCGDTNNYRSDPGYQHPLPSEDEVRRSGPGGLLPPDLARQRATQDPRPPSPGPPLPSPQQRAWQTRQEQAQQSTQTRPEGTAVSDLQTVAAQLQALAAELPTGAVQSLSSALESVAGQASGIVAGTGHEHIVGETIAVKQAIEQDIAARLQQLAQQYQDVATAIVGGR